MNLDDALLGSAKQAAAARGTTLGRLIEDALREALARRPELEAASAALKARRQRDWRVAAAAATALLD